MPKQILRQIPKYFSLSKIRTRPVWLSTQSVDLLPAHHVPPRRTRFWSCLVAFGLVAAGSQSALGAQQCMMATEKTAFDVRVLQSQLMITALSCGQRDEYNVFVLRHQRDLAAADRMIGLHFNRIYGPGGEQQHDEYVTTLANAQSQDGIRQGPWFCSDMKIFVLQSLTLQSIEEMSRFVANRNVTNPYALMPCESVQDTNVEMKPGDLTRPRNQSALAQRQ